MGGEDHLFLSLKTSVELYMHSHVLKLTVQSSVHFPISTGQVATDVIGITDLAVSTDVVSRHDRLISSSLFQDLNSKFSFYTWSQVTHCRT